MRCAEAMVRKDASVAAAEEQPPRQTSRGKTKVAGEAFFITNGEPTEFWGFGRLVWRLAGDRAPRLRNHRGAMWVAFFMEWVAEWVIWVVSGGMKRPEKFNKSQMGNCSLDKTFDTGKAKERLGWEPKVGLEEGGWKGGGMGDEG